MADDDRHAPELRSLFGGAITAAIPRRFADVSKFRQIPDNQEVFADAVTDQSIIIELLSLVPEVEAQGAAAHHFASIAHDNEATASQIESPSDVVPQDHVNGTLSTCYGTQAVAKFREGAAHQNTIRVHVACFRLPDVTTDMVVSFNTPVALAAGSSSVESVDAGQMMADANPQAAAQLFTAVVDSVKVLDYGLFVHEDEQEPMQQG